MKISGKWGRKMIMKKEGFALKNLIIIIALIMVVVLTVHFIKKKGSKVASITNFYNDYLQSQEVKDEFVDSSLMELIKSEGSNLILCSSEVPEGAFVEEVTEGDDLIYLKMNYLKEPISIKMEKQDSLWKIIEINCPITEEIEKEEVADVTIEEKEIAPVKVAKEDLSLRLGIDKSEVKLKSLESVIFSDSTLGTSAPGEVYNQKPVSGYLIILSLGEHDYRYHADNYRVVFIP